MLSSTTLENARACSACTSFLHSNGTVRRLGAIPNRTMFAQLEQGMRARVCTRINISRKKLSVTATNLPAEFDIYRKPVRLLTLKALRRANRRHVRLINTLKTFKKWKKKKEKKTLRCETERYVSSRNVMECHYTYMFFFLFFFLMFKHLCFFYSPKFLYSLERFPCD